MQVQNPLLHEVTTVGEPVTLMVNPFADGSFVRLFMSACHDSVEIGFRENEIPNTQRIPRGDPLDTEKGNTRLCGPIPASTPAYHTQRQVRIPLAGHGTGVAQLGHDVGFFVWVAPTLSTHGSPKGSGVAASGDWCEWESPIESSVQRCRRTANHIASLEQCLTVPSSVLAPSSKARSP